MFVEEKGGSVALDGVRATIDTSGTVEVVTGAASVGQGVETVIAQICADTLGVDYRRVRVVHGQTDRIAFGLGAFGYRVTVMTGEANAPCRDKTPRQGNRGRGDFAAVPARGARRHRRQGSEQSGSEASITLGEGGAGAWCRRRNFLPRATPGF